MDMQHSESQKWVVKYDSILSAFQWKVEENNKKVCGKYYNQSKFIAENFHLDKSSFQSDLFWPQEENFNSELKVTFQL